jgi:myo-inositol-1(or 4)-monophosphatase
VTDFNGDKFSVYQHRILATNGKIHDEMLDVINQRKEL